jgi:hypothetical protein
VHIATSQEVGATPIRFCIPDPGILKSGSVRPQSVSLERSRLTIRMEISAIIVTDKSAMLPNYALTGDSMIATTADLSDAYPQAHIADSIFRDFGGVPMFYGPVTTLKVFADNAIVRILLE